MSLKLKVLGLGLLAVTAMGAVAVMNAGATVSGHFTSSVDTTTITGIESGLHKVELSAPALSKDKIHCNKANYHGHVTAPTTTFTDVTITPTYAECTTTESKAVVHVNMNGCTYTLFSVTTPGATDATVTLKCPAGKKADVLDTGTGCTLEFGEQTLEAAVYHTDLSPKDKKHALTVTITGEKIKFEAHSGICVFVGTNQAGGELTGSLTVFGEDINGKEVDITAT